MAGLGIQTRGTGIARVQKKGGGIAQRGMGAAFKKGGKVKKADMMTKDMPMKKKGKMMKGKR